MAQIEFAGFTDKKHAYKEIFISDSLPSIKRNDTLQILALKNILNAYVKKVYPIQVDTLPDIDNFIDVKFVAEIYVFDSINLNDSIWKSENLEFCNCQLEYATLMAFKSKHIKNLRLGVCKDFNFPGGVYNLSKGEIIYKTSMGTESIKKEDFISLCFRILISEKWFDLIYIELNYNEKAFIREIYFQPYSKNKKELFFNIYSL